MRKRRSDRNHIIYKIENTCTGEFYIGLTVLRGRAYLGSIKLRLKQHISRAQTQGLTWSLCESIRAYGPQSFTIQYLESVRGKQNAHTRETQLIKELQPSLNTTSIAR
jgi:hypothetical protein